MATNDLLSTTEAKQYLGMGTADASKGTLLAAYVTAASTRIVAGVGPIVYGTVTAELHNGGGDHIYLDQTPVQSVVSVVEYDDTVAGTLTAETVSSQPAAGYHVNTVNGRITRRNDGGNDLFPNGMDNVSVTYVAGRCATTATVPERYKLACGLMLQHLWRSQQTSAAVLGEFDVPQNNFPRFAVPNAVKELLAEEWRSSSGFVG